MEFKHHLVKMNDKKGRRLRRFANSMSKTFYFYIDHSDVSYNFRIQSMIDYLEDELRHCVLKLFSCQPNDFQITLVKLPNGINILTEVAIFQYLKDKFEMQWVVKHFGDRPNPIFIMNYNDSENMIEDENHFRDQRSLSSERDLLEDRVCSVEDSNVEQKSAVLEETKKADAEQEINVIEETKNAHADAEQEITVLEETKKADAEQEITVIEETKNAHADAEQEITVIEETKNAHAEQKTMMLMMLTMMTTITVCCLIPVIVGLVMSFQICHGRDYSGQCFQLDPVTLALDKSNPPAVLPTKTAGGKKVVDSTSVMFVNSKKMKYCLVDEEMKSSEQRMWDDVNQSKPSILFLDSNENNNICKLQSGIGQDIIDLDTSMKYCLGDEQVNFPESECQLYDPWSKVPTVLVADSRGYENTTADKVQVVNLLNDDAKNFIERSGHQVYHIHPRLSEGDKKWENIFHLFFCVLLFPGCWRITSNLLVNFKEIAVKRLKKWIRKDGSNGLKKLILKSPVTSLLLFVLILFAAKADARARAEDDDIRIRNIRAEFHKSFELNLTGSTTNNSYLFTNVTCIGCDRYKILNGTSGIRLKDNGFVIDSFEPYNEGQYNVRRKSQDGISSEIYNIWAEKDLQCSRFLQMNGWELRLTMQVDGYAPTLLWKRNGKVMSSKSEINTAEGRINEYLLVPENETGAAVYTVGINDWDQNLSHDVFISLCNWTFSDADHRDLVDQDQSSQNRWWISAVIIVFLAVLLGFVVWMKWNKIKTFCHRSTDNSKIDQLLDV